MQTPLVETDWVRARAGTSSLVVFQRLVAGVRKDVGARNATRKPGDTFRVEAVVSEQECTVTRFDDVGSMYVRFVLTPSGIEARGDGGGIRATLTLDSQGHCGLNVNGVATQDWQFRQMALQSLFFDETSSSPVHPAAPTARLSMLAARDTTHNRGGTERRHRLSAHSSERLLT